MATGCLAVAGVWSVVKMPAGYAATNAYNSIFCKLMPQASSVEIALAELALEPDDRRHIGVHAFQREAPLEDRAWRKRFEERSGYGKLLRYYLMHPYELVRRLWLTLKLHAPTLREPHFGNYRRETNMPPASKDYRVSVWSNTRAALTARWPAHLLLIYLAAPIAAWLARTSWPQLALVLPALAVAGALEFIVTGLGDGVETSRQLIVFQAITDMLICGLAASVASSLTIRKLWRESVATSVRSGWHPWAPSSVRGRRTVPQS
jgi:hypothetical protein